MSSRLPAALGALWLLLSAFILGSELGRQPEILVRWVTETEMNTAGYNLYRALSPDGPFEKINSRLILSEGDPMIGAEYEYSDPIVRRDQTYYYQLEEVEVDGDSIKLDMIHARVDPIRTGVVALAGAGLLIGGYLLVSALLTLRSRSSKVTELDAKSMTQGPSEGKASDG